MGLVGSHAAISNLAMLRNRAAILDSVASFPNAFTP
jgi:hypothetical protein